MKIKNAVRKTTENKSGFFKPISRRTFLTGSAAAMAALASEGIQAYEIGEIVAGEEQIILE